MRKMLALLAGVVLIALLAACNLSDMFKGKTADSQSAQNPPPQTPAAADNQVPPPPPENPPPSNQGYQNTAPSRQAPTSSYPAPANYNQGSGYGNQGSYAQAPQYSRAQIEQMVAPIALYPDALMTQVLMAAAYPYDVADADQWIQSNRGLSGAYLDEALATSSWDPSVIALCKFPSALDRMGGDIQWTTDLGNAFLNQRSDVMSAIQRLRQEAYRSGHLQTSSQQRVVVEPQYIVIQPYNPNVYYVPYYNPTIVYGSSWNYPNYYYPNVWNPSPYYSPGYSFVNGFAWGIGMSFGNVLFGGYDWNRQNVYVNNNVFYNNNIYRNTDYYRNRNMYAGQTQTNWAYNDRYNQPNEGFVRAPYAGRAHGNVRALPENAVRGGKNRSYLETNFTKGAGAGRNRLEGAGQVQGQAPGAGTNRLEGTGAGQGQHPGGPGHGQGQGLGQGQGPHPGGQGSKGQGQGMGPGHNEGQGLGQGRGPHPGGQGSKGQGQGMGPGHNEGLGQGQGQGGGKNKMQGQGQGMGQGQGGGKNKMQGQGQGMGQGQGGGKNKMQGQGQGMGQGQGQGGGKNKMQGAGQGQGQGGGKHKKEGAGQGKGQGGQNQPTDQPNKKNKGQG